MKYTQEETTTTFLTLEEVRRIASKHFSHERLNLVRDMFLFSFFTVVALMRNMVFINKLRRVKIKLVTI